MRPVRFALGRLDVDGLGLAALIFLKLVGQALVLLQRAHSRLFDGGDVNEGVISAIIRMDEAVALGIVEKLDCADRHVVIPSIVANRQSVRRC